MILMPLSPRGIKLNCHYVALAEHAGCQLVTADQKSINNLAPHFPFILPLASLP
jgi:hypothetical protein